MDPRLGTLFHKTRVWLPVLTLGSSTFTSGSRGFDAFSLLLWVHAGALASVCTHTPPRPHPHTHTRAHAHTWGSQGGEGGRGRGKRRQREGEVRERGRKRFKNILKENYSCENCYVYCDNKNHIQRIHWALQARREARGGASSEPWEVPTQSQPWSGTPELWNPVITITADFKPWSLWHFAMATLGNWLMPQRRRFRESVLALYGRNAMWVIYVIDLERILGTDEAAQDWTWRKWSQ